MNFILPLTCNARGDSEGARGGHPHWPDPASCQCEGLPYTDSAGVQMYLREGEEGYSCLSINLAHFCQAHSVVKVIG